MINKIFANKHDNAIKKKNEVYQYWFISNLRDLLQMLKNWTIKLNLIASSKNRNLISKKDIKSFITK